MKNLAGYWDVKGQEKKCAHYFEQAAMLGDDNSQYTLVCFYLDGVGVEVNFEKARYWAEIFASQGNPDGEYLLSIVDSAEASYREDPESYLKKLQ